MDNNKIVGYEIGQDAKLSELFSNELKSLLVYMTKELVDEYPTLSVTTDYFMLAVILHRDNKAYKIMEDLLMTDKINEIGVNYGRIVSNSASTAIRPTSKLRFSKEFNSHLVQAKAKMDEIGDKSITSEHILLSILSSDTNDKTILESVGLTYNIVYNKILRDEERTKNKSEVDQHTAYQLSIIPITGTSIVALTKDQPEAKARQNIPRKNKANGKGSYISQYTIDLIELASGGFIDRVIGRDEEIEEIFRVFGRRNKNNVLLVGDGGVGKTAIVKHIANLINDGDVPRIFKDKKFIQLDLAAIIAGTSFRGMFEERVKGILDEAKKNRNYIIFIDDIHGFINDKTQNGDINIMSVIGDALTEGSVQFIGTTNFKDCKSAIDSNTSIARKFQKIKIEQPSVEKAIDILEGCKSYYASYHHAIFPKETIETCVKLSKRYISERALPDSAIDLMDEAGSNKNIFAKVPAEYKEMEDKLAEIKGKQDAAIREDDFYKLDILKRKENELMVDMAKFKRNYNPDPVEVTPEDIYTLISIKTGIPVSRLTINEKASLAKINDVLKQSIIGQDDAIDKACMVIKRNRVGLGNENHPPVLMCIGKSGVGKTLLAKQLAKEIFGDEKYLVRLDMSEYADKTSITRIVGSSPSYVGYNDANSLADTIRNKKYAVLLLDEIEKADAQVFNVFLQVFDDGRLTDGTGNVVDFKNVIIILTSNIGTKMAMDFKDGVGFNTGSDVDRNKRSASIIRKELKRKFQPEFLNRIDDIIYFNDLTQDNLNHIVKLEMNKVKKQIENIGYDLNETFFDDAVSEHILSLSNEESGNGARPIVRLIQTEVIDQITDKILENEYPKEYAFSCSVDKEHNRISII